MSRLELRQFHAAGHHLAFVSVYSNLALVDSVCAYSVTFGRCRVVPTYEYECPDCEHRFEVFQSFQDAPLTSCEECGGKLKKVFHPAGIIFKGSGWYATDSRTNAERKKFREDGKPSEKSDSKPVKSDGAKSNGSESGGSTKAGASAGGSGGTSDSGGSSK